MVCLYCYSKTKIINSRKHKIANQTWRRHRCENCLSVFTTKEIVDLASAFRISNQNGSLTPFLREKLLLDIYEALKHRKSALNDSIALTNTIIAKSKSVSGIIDRKELIETVSKVLKRFDKAAHSYYTAYHVE